MKAVWISEIKAVLCTIMLLTASMLMSCSEASGPTGTHANVADARTDGKYASGLQKKNAGVIVVSPLDVFDCVTGDTIHFTGQVTAVTSTTAAGRRMVTVTKGIYTSVDGRTYTTSTTEEYERPNYNQKTGEGSCPYTLTTTFTSTLSGASAPFEYQDVVIVDANCVKISSTRVYQRGGC